MKILLTGANGFIGRNIKEKIGSEYLLDSPEKAKLDLLNPESVKSVIKNGGYDIIIHSANINNSRKREVSSFSVLQGNLLMFYNLLKYREYFGKMIYFGSGAEFDVENYIPKMNENFFGQYVPKDAYGLSKYIMGKESEKDINVFNFRLFGVYGPYEEWEHRFISNAICRILYDMPITINQNVYFDYLWVDDLVSILKKMMVKDLKYKHYNICSGKRIDLYTLAQIVKKVCQSSNPIIVKNQGLKREYTGDNKRMLNELGEFEFTGFESAVQQLYNYYKEHRDMINPNILV